MHLRNKVQGQIQSSVVAGGMQILRDEDDDDDGDDDDDDKGIDMKYVNGTTPNETLLNLEQHDEHPSSSTHTHTQTSTSQQSKLKSNHGGSGKVPPMEDLTIQKQKQPIMNQNTHHKSNAFQNLIRRDWDHGHNKGGAQAQEALSPPRPFKQPVQHAKRAVSTLFGSSVVVSEEKKDATAIAATGSGRESGNNNGLRHLSLLDVVTQGGNGSNDCRSGGSVARGFARRWQKHTSAASSSKSMQEGLEYGDMSLYHDDTEQRGLEIEMEQSHDRLHKRQGLGHNRHQGQNWNRKHDSHDDLMDFTSDTSFAPIPQAPQIRQSVPNPIQQMHMPMHMEKDHTQSTQNASSPGIDVGDPFSYHERSIMNQRNGQRQRRNASSVAKSWFGNTLNYTTSAIRMKNPRYNSRTGSDDENDSVSTQEHQLLDKLHQAGAKRTTGTSGTGFISPITSPRTSLRNLRNHMNELNIALALSYGIISAASCVPITLVPTIAMDVLSQTNDQENQNDAADADDSLEAAASKFASTVATYAVLGTAFGKFLNGPLGDIFGARRVACLYALLLSVALTMLSFGHTGWEIVACCSAVEYLSSVQWPCMTVILAAHYGNDSLESSNGGGSDGGLSNSPPQQGIYRNNVAGRYEKGVYITSLGARVGSLMASVSTTILLRYMQDTWRVVARLAALVCIPKRGSLSILFIVSFSLVDLVDVESLSTIQF